MNTILFHHNPALLDRFKGHLHVDGYGIYRAYDGKAGITLLNCMRHALQKFKDARSTDPFKAAIAIHFFDKLYEIEAYCSANDLGEGFRKSLRRQISAPAFRNLAKWVESELHDLKEVEGLLGIALKYFNKREKQLSAFLDNGLLYIDTDHLENIIKRISLSWKHHPVRSLKVPGQTTAILYSLMITCELHGVDPYAWLKDISLLDPRFPLDQVNLLLPYNLATHEKFNCKSICKEDLLLLQAIRNNNNISPKGTLIY